MTWWYISAAPARDALMKIAGWSSQVARQAHNLKAAGSNPAPATPKKYRKSRYFFISGKRGEEACSYLGKISLWTFRGFFVRRYCAESCRAWICCRLIRCLGVGYAHFRMRVGRYDETEHGAFSWRLEDAFRVLREAGFLLYDDGRGEWTPCNIYRHLVEQGRAEGGMLVLRERRGGFEKVQVF